MRRSGNAVSWFLHRQLLPRLQTFCTSTHRETLGVDCAMLEVWAWGKADVGQLGSGDDRTRKSPHLVGSMEVPPNVRLAPMQGLPREVPLAHHLNRSGVDAAHVGEGCDGIMEGSPAPTLGLACGLFHSALLVDGELWTWGKGDAGRLGLGSEEPKYTLTSNPYLGPVQSVALGGLHSAAVTQDGGLYTWGFGGFGALGHGTYKRELQPRKVNLNQDEKVVYVSAGGAHTAAITASGDLYTWGRDEGEGRLGHGYAIVTDDGAVSLPVKLDSMPEPVAAVSCGGFFTMALTSRGQVWSWGANSNYELGRGDIQPRCEPSPVPEIESMCIVQVVCGGYHSAALTDDGKVLTWGRGGHGQLGHGSFDNGRIPRVVEALANSHVVYISCGSTWTAAITDTGALYCWGKNADYQLGFSGKRDAEMVPTQLTFDLKDTLTKSCRSAVAVAAGACHGICLVLR